MSSNKSARVLAAAALVAALFLAAPAAAVDGRGASPGLLERLVAWFAETWSGQLAGGTGDPAGTNDSQSPVLHTDGEGDPEGCRDYTACIDPNG